VGTTPLSKARILRSIKDFLKQRSSPPKSRQCRQCGSQVQFLGTNFLLSGTTINRHVFLPVCPVCEHEVLQNLPRPETIH
jgi:hypothetical protein